MTELWLFIIIILLLFIGGWVSAAETALFSLPESRLSAFRLFGNEREKRIGTLLLKPQDLLVTIFMINTIVNILFQNASSSFVGNHAGYLLKVGVPFFLVLVFGEILPKYYGIQNSYSFANRVVYSFEWIQKIFEPIRFIVVAITRRLSRLLFFFMQKSEPLTRQEIELLVRSSASHGILSKEEEALIQGYLSLQASPVKEHMWPRKEIVAYNILEPLSKLTHLFCEEKISRIPVIQETLDHVHGFMEAPLFFKIESTIKKGGELIPYLEKPLYVPENTSAKVLLDRFLSEKVESALIVDEYGVVVGLITQEDLMEIVVGPILDEREESEYTLSAKKELICAGSLPLKEFNEIYKSAILSRVGFMTIGGWITEQTETIPKAGSNFTLEGFRFHILAAEPTHIEKLYVRQELPNGK